MSAFIVGKPHIDQLVAVAQFGPQGHRPNWNFHYYHAGQSKRVDRTNGNSVGYLLWEENRRSVAYRYPDDTDGERPGPIGLTDSETAGYTASTIRTRLSVVAALKAIRCLDYQSCEHPEWEASEAKTLLDTLTLYLISELPGYDEAPWECI